MGSHYIKDIRSKIGNAPLMIPSVAAVILNVDNELLLQEKANEHWSLPAGMIELGESPKQALIREVEEETGLIVLPTKILGVFGGEGFSYTYPNGHPVEYTVILMLCEVVGNANNTLDPETKSLHYFPKHKMPELALPYPVEALYNEIESPLIT